MSDADLLKILDELRNLQREAGTVEFKGNVQEPIEIGQYLSALANSAALEGHNRGWMVWGVEDGTHEVMGTHFNPFIKKGEGNQSLVMWLQQKTAPKADFDFHEAHHQSGKVILLEIHPPRSAPIAFAGIRYIRIGSHKTQLTNHPDKEARLWEMLGLKDDWSGEIVRDARMDDLDPDAVQDARKRFGEYRVKSEQDASRHARIRQETNSWDVTTLLNKARLAKSGRLTRAGLLLLGKDESAHFISPVDAKMSWILRENDGGTVGSQHYGCPFLLSTDRLFSRIRNLVMERMPDGTLFPEALQQYDAWVIREALHNAIAHQDYRLGGKINVSEFPDRIVLSNLGQFIPPSVEWMLTQQSPPEYYRNQWLIDAMIRLRMIDQVGSGIRRMFETQRERNFPLPDYTIDRGDGHSPRVEVSIPGRILDARYTKLLMSRDDIPLQDIVLLDRAQKGNRLSKPEAAHLRKVRLEEGRYPNLYVGAKVAATTGGQAQHIRNRGFDNKYYRDLLEDLIREHGPVGPTVIQELLLEKLPESLNDGQKKAKIRNLTFDLGHRRGRIVNVGGRGTHARWQIQVGGQTKPGGEVLD
jgi:ATP-dependent DNA helicase RecG